MERDEFMARAMIAALGGMLAGETTWRVSESSHRRVEGFYFGSFDTPATAARGYAEELWAQYQEATNGKA